MENTQNLVRRPPTATVHTILFFPIRNTYSRYVKTLTKLSKEVRHKVENTPNGDKLGMAISIHYGRKVKYNC